ncbi:trypco2 family protein [Streptomyces sp. NPDC002176]|uniref:trypco2 family protein n=1 Tax=Streptomyces sp. NPDC002176 TaxID=3364634 RepID=UPI00384F959A
MPRTNLAAAIQTLYTELHTAMTTIQVKDGLNLRYDSVEVELAMEMSESDELGGGAKFWVVEASGKKASEERVTHTVRLNLTPVAAPSSHLRLGPDMVVSAGCGTNDYDGDALGRIVSDESIHFAGHGAPPFTAISPQLDPDSTR